jgi:hypothetical protein
MYGKEEEMKFLDYKTVLEEHGYLVTEEAVTTRLGDVLAAFDPYGDYWCSDGKVQEILSSKVTAVKTEKKKTGKKVRARTEKGYFVKDDPNTPENEAWTTE